MATSGEATGGEETGGVTAGAPGAAIAVEPGLRLVRAPNPSPMTHTGTNSWIVGVGTGGDVAVIDPGPDDAGHLAALLAALGPGERVGHILVTHAHRDHAPLARRLAAETGAPVMAAGRMAERRRPVMARLAAAGGLGGGEGVDSAFTPDIVLEDGALVAGAGWQLTALATPGHTADHLCFLWEAPGRGPALFSGDTVMGWASSLVSPPDGDVVAFLASCRRLLETPARVFYPGHGDPVADPAGRLAWLIAHREGREAQILAALAEGPAGVPALAERIYADAPAGLLRAAERNVLAHLIALWEAGRVRAVPALAADATFALA